jgi:hypothetical protein
MTEDYRIALRLSSFIFRSPLLHFSFSLHLPSAFSISL